MGAAAITYDQDDNPVFNVSNWGSVAHFFRAQALWSRADVALDPVIERLHPLQLPSPPAGWVEERAPYQPDPVLWDLRNFGQLGDL